MLTLQQIRDALKDRNLAKVSEATGVGYAVIVRLANGGDTSYENGRTLALYLMEQAGVIKSATRE